MAAPVRRDDEVELQVDSLAYGGNGVARLNGFVVFVRRGLPGDRVRARVTKVKRGFAEALATEILEPSPQRVDAPCAHYPACGGCRFQDLDYAVQVAAKEAQVRDALVRIGGPLARLARFADLNDQVEACRRVFASDTRWTVVRGSDLEEGEGQGLPVWSRHVGDPILESNRTRRIDFALFMVEALENDELVHEARRSSAA